jgi:membrane protein implicated in regulation of membrane protease activity
MNFWNWVLMVAGAVLVLIEVALGGFAGFDLVLIGSAFVLGGGIGLALNNPMIGFATAAVLCLAYIGVGRRIVRARWHTGRTASNTDALLGREALVLERVAAHAPGQVKVNDEVWRAELATDIAGPLEPGSRVTVAGINGVTLQVR